MSKITYVLNQINTIFDITGYHFTAAGDVLYGTCRPNEYLLALLKELNRKFRKETRDARIPGIYIVEKNMYFWILSLEEGTMCTFGPVGGEFLTSGQLDAFRHHYHLGDSDLKMPQLTLLKLLGLMGMSCYMLTGMELSEEDIRRANAGNMEVGDADIVDYQIYRYNEDKTRQSYEEERRWLTYIRDGAMDELSVHTITQQKLMQMYERIGVMADNDYKQLEYMVVSCVTLATRAAIIGGAPPFVCYEISDLFLQKTSKCQNVLELLEIATKAPEKFARLVCEYKNGNHYGAVIERCKDYIARNLYHKFTIGDMAKALSMNRSYLSQIFSERTGETLQYYIRKERLKAAANLLKYSEESVGQIAEYMQFSSTGRFCGYIKEIYQMTPVEYRDKYKVIDFVSK